MGWVDGLSYEASDFSLKISRWDFPDSGITCVFGESGSGKTTLLQIMAGLLPSPHELCVSGEILSNLTTKSKNIGFVFQDFALFPHMTVIENLEFAALAKNIPAEIRKNQIERLVERLDLKSIQNQKAKTLSGGEQQRVALGRALVTKPKMVLLDEPLSALDEIRKENARSLIRDLSKEFQVPFILVTHDLRDVRNLSHDLLLLQKGEVLGYGKTLEILNHPSSLEMARGIPENQIIKVNATSHLVEIGGTQFTPQKALECGGKENFLVFKPWSLVISNSQSPAPIAFKGSLLEIFNEGPHWSCVVRLSSGQKVKAVAPLKESPKDQVLLYLNLEEAILFEGRD